MILKHHKEGQTISYICRLGQVCGPPDAAWTIRTRAVSKGENNPHIHPTNKWTNKSGMSIQWGITQPQKKNEVLFILHYGKHHLSIRSQLQKTTYYMCPFICFYEMSKIGKSIEKKKRLVVA